MRAALMAAVAAALSFQVALAAPARLTAQLRAAACCAADCSRAMGRRCDCCHVTQGADGLRALPPTSSLGLPAVALLMDPVPVAASNGAPASLQGYEPARNGPPLFLAQRSLRL